MHSVTVDILNEKAMKLLRDMELLELIKLRSDKKEKKPAISLWHKYKGALAKQPVNEVDEQLADLRDQWD